MTPARIRVCHEIGVRTGRERSGIGKKPKFGGTRKKRAAKDRRAKVYSWRHTFETNGRGVVDTEMRNYISGHANSIAEKYGDYLVPKLLREIKKLKDPTQMKVKNAA